MDVRLTSCILLLAHFVGGDYPWYVDSTHWSVECPPWNGELVFLADPTDCAKYYACTPSGPVHYDCPSELWWDTKQDICNWPNEVKCKGMFWSLTQVILCISLYDHIFNRSFSFDFYYQWKLIALIHGLYRKKDRAVFCIPMNQWIFSKQKR